MLDLECGGGELLAGLPALPAVARGAEGYAPNVAVAATAPAPTRWTVVAIDQAHEALPFAAASFDLVTSRHPITTWWDEIAPRARARAAPTSRSRSDPHSVRELSESCSARSRSSARDPGRRRGGRRSAGLVVRDLRLGAPPNVFDDVGAVVYFLRLVVWIVPGFTVERFRDRLLALHAQIERDGPFVAHASRFLIEASKPG